MNQAASGEVFLILICGLPGTGKTTLARILSAGLRGYTLLDQNEIRRKHGMRRMPKSQDAVLREIDRTAAECLRKNKGVIFESVNRYSFRRHQIYGIASCCGKRVLVIEVVCGESTAKARMRERESGDGLLSDPSDPKVYDRLKALWDDVMIDFRYPGEDHVSYVQFDSESQKFKCVIARERMKRFINFLGRLCEGENASDFR